VFSNCGVKVKSILANVRTTNFMGALYFVEDFLTFDDLCVLRDFGVKTIKLGLSTDFSIGNYYHARNPFGKKDLQLMNKGLRSFEDYLLYGGLKVVFVDLDNTLIPGVFAEERELVVQNYSNSKYYHYHYFKEFLIFLAKKGVAIVIVSKNDIETVYDALDTLCPDLKRIAVGVSADYSSKSDRISQIIDKFNVNQKNCLFIDDNMVEISEVSSALNVNCFHFGPDRLIELISAYTHIFSNYSEVTINYYKTILGKIDSNEALSHAQVDFTYNIFTNETGHYERLIELSIKTNQMNFNKFPLNKEILMKSTVLSIDCTNENGYLGVVGYGVIIEELDGGNLLQFVMSCRALGFGLERLFLKYIISEHNVKTINFVETERNSVAKILLNEIKP
jgi:FkbH-like protein